MKNRIATILTRAEKEAKQKLRAEEEAKQRQEAKSRRTSRA